MSKSYSRDIVVLIKVLNYVNTLKEDLKVYNVKDFRTFNDSDRCKRLCAFSVLQIAELGKQLTKETYESIPYFRNGSIIAVRNMIAHDYLGLQIAMLYSFVEICISKENCSILRDRIAYCKSMKRK